VTSDSYIEEINRLDGMLAYERQYPEYDYIAGIDEAGRGPLAGPVVACAVILPRECKILYVNDSKKLSERMRDALYVEIGQRAIAIGIGVVPHDVVDEVNILNATYEAMREAIRSVSKIRKPQLLLNDAVTIPQVDIPQVPIIKGDAKSMSIAAASIVAKVTRDGIMRGYDVAYPGYGFASHKGYGTKGHIEALGRLGACDIHRRSFMKKFV